MESKKPWLSKTLWVNFLVALFAITGLQQKFPVTEEQFIMFISLVNIVLRFVTKDKIEIASK